MGLSTGMHPQPPIRPISLGLTSREAQSWQGRLDPGRFGTCLSPSCHVLYLEFPLKIWALPPQTGLCTAEHQGSQGELFETQGLICCHVPCEVSHLPCNSRCHRQCRCPRRCVSCLTAASKVGRPPTTWSSCRPNTHSSRSINSLFGAQPSVCFVSFLCFPGEFLHRPAGSFPIITPPSFASCLLHFP